VIPYPWKFSASPLGKISTARNQYGLFELGPKEQPGTLYGKEVHVTAGGRKNMHSHSLGVSVIHEGHE
jgi:hypothetical protein